MSGLVTKTIREAARKIVLNKSGGIRFTELASAIQTELPDANLNTIGAQIRQLPIDYPESIEKPSRGLYAPIENNDKAEEELTADPKTKSGLKEEEFYAPFATYLRDALDECTVAVDISSMRRQGKWTNPDVVGINRPPAHYVIQFESEIVSAEIKIDPSESIVGFGQAVAYRLFSHKTYLVLPDTVPETDKSKIINLCQIYGIGLIYFALNPNNPNFEVKLFAQKFQPDMVSLNDFAEKIRNSNASAYNSLFA